MRRVARFFAHIDNASRHSAAYSERHFVLFGYLSWCIPLATLIDYFVGNPYYDTLYVRLSVSVLAIPLVIYPKLSGLLAEKFYVYFSFITAYAFPYCYAHMLVMNAAEAPPDSNIHMIWIFQYIISLFLFIQLINNGVLAILLWALASAAALLPIPFLQEPNYPELERVILYPVSGYFTALLFGILTNRNIDIVNTEKIRTAAAIGSNIAHELRTPLASVRSMSHGLRNYLPSLVDGYDKAKAANLPVEEIRPKQLEQIKTLLTRIESEVDYSNTVIDMLLINTADKPFTGVEYDRFGALAAIDESISRYPFNNQQERQLLRVAESEDFEIHAPRLLIVHVLFNLIKNGLYYVQRAGKGDITLSTERGTTANKLIVHDTGAGIPESELRQIFERFYTTTQTGQGAGIGLSFCDMVMRSVGGEISCASVEGQHTTFTLTFPATGEDGNSARG